MTEEQTREDLIAEVDQHRLSLVWYSYGLVKNWQTAEDVVQETFITINDNWKSYSAGKSVFSWARGIARRKSFEAIRELNRENPMESDRLDDFLEKSLENAWNVSSTNHLQEKVRLLRDCVIHLSPNAQKVLFDFYLHGNSYKKIAKSTNKSISQIKDSLFRLRNKLRQCVNSKSKTKEEAQDEMAPNPEFLDEIYFNHKDLIPEEREVIVNTLKSFPNSKHWLRNCILEHAAISEACKELEGKKETTSTQFIVSPEAGFDVIEPRTLALRKRTPFHFRTVLSIAACAVLVSCLVWWNPKQTSKSPEPYAQLISLSGDVMLVRSNLEPRIAKPGEPLYPGDAIQTEGGAETNLRLADEASYIKVLPYSSFQLNNPSMDPGIGGNDFFLSRGQITASVERQNLELPMTISTPHAKIVVLGTRFQLESSPSSALLRVIKGRVKFTNSVSNKSIIVTENQSYRISEGNPSITEASYYGNEISNGLIGKFSFEEPPGKIIFDSISKSRGQYLNRLLEPEKSWVHGKYGSGFRFPTLEENFQKPRSIRVNRFPNEKVSDRLTIAMWLKPLSSNDLEDSGSSQLIGARDFSSGKDAGTGWLAGIEKIDHRYSVFFYINERKNTLNTNGNKITSPPIILEDAWSHLCIVFDSGNATLYINGEQHKAKNFKDSTIRTGDYQGLIIGPHKAASFGIMDEVLIYNTALGHDDITQLNH